MMLQLNPMIPVIVTSKGGERGYAFLVTDRGEECYKMWSVIMDKSGEIWDIPNTEVRVQSNWTLGRRHLTTD